MSAFKVGDEVRIVSREIIQSFEEDSEWGGYRTPNGLLVTPSMLSYCGCYFIISKVENNNGCAPIMILQNNMWRWDEYCLEPVPDFEGLEELL